MNLILFGPPGAGKGTQSELLIERLKLKHISTGDLFRQAIRDNTPLGREAKSILDAGNLVPDSITIGLVDEQLKKIGGTNFILDGFPRNIAQAEALEKILQGLGQKIDKTVFLAVPTEQLLKRLTGRRVCKSCGAVFHVDSKPPKKDGVCDACGGQVIQRADDQEGVIANRLDAYEKSTRPLKDYYKANGPYVEIDGTGNSEEVFERIAKILQVKT